MAKPSATVRGQVSPLFVFESRRSATMALRWNELEDDLPPTPGKENSVLLCLVSRRPPADSARPLVLLFSDVQAPCANCGCLCMGRRVTIARAPQQLPAACSFRLDRRDTWQPRGRVCKAACPGRTSGTCRAQMKLTTRRMMVMSAIAHCRRVSSLVRQRYPQHKERLHWKRNCLARTRRLTRQFPTSGQRGGGAQRAGIEPSHPVRKLATADNQTSP